VVFAGGGGGGHVLVTEFRGPLLEFNSDFGILGWDAFDTPHWREGVKISSSYAAFTIIIYESQLWHQMAYFVLVCR